MTGHPEGTAFTERLLALSKLRPCRVLDMGAGAGESVALLRRQGFDAVGIDRAPGPALLCGDFFHCPFPAKSFDAVLSECAFFISGDMTAALREAARLLRPGGLLLLSDVYFGAAEEIEAAIESSGFRLVCFEDAGAAWKQYYIECIWRGTAEGMPSCTGGRKCSYYLAVCERMCV